MRPEDILNLDPETATDDELEEALGECVRLIRKLKADRDAAKNLEQGLGGKLAPLRVKQNAIRQEIKRR